MEIALDPIKCEAHGLCAELLPERITLDEWGYPIIDPAPIPPGLEDLARRAVNTCPTLALRLRAAENNLANLNGAQPKAVPSGRSGEAAQRGRTGSYQVYRSRRR